MNKILLIISTLLLFFFGLGQEIHINIDDFKLENKLSNKELYDLDIKEDTFSLKITELRIDEKVTKEVFNSSDAKLNETWIKYNYKRKSLLYFEFYKNNKLLTFLQFDPKKIKTKGLVVTISYPWGFNLRYLNALK